MIFIYLWKIISKYFHNLIGEGVLELVNHFQFNVIQ